MDLISNDSIDLAIAQGSTTIGSATGTLVGAQVALCQSDTFTLNRVTPLSILQANEANYTGYAKQAVTWQAPSIADDGTLEVIGTVPQFRPTGAAVQNNIFSLFVELGTSTLCFCGAFDVPPLPMRGTTDQITVTLRYRPQQGGIVAVVS